MTKPQIHIASCSFGKDSIATILLAKEHNEPLDHIVFAEVMFDNARGISGEIPEHIEWIYNTAIPRLEQITGIKVDVVRSKEDFMGEFNHVITNKTKHPERIGKKRAFPLGLKCVIQRDLKLNTIRDYYKQFAEYDVIQYVGIAKDENERLKRVDGSKKVSILAKYDYTEKNAYDLVKENNLLSPIYDTGTRGGVGSAPIKD